MKIPLIIILEILKRLVLLILLPIITILGTLGAILSIIFYPKPIPIRTSDDPLDRLRRIRDV